MGRYEDLIQQARDGDATALDALESEFSGSELRKMAETNTEAAVKYQESLPLIRKAKLDELSGQLEDDLKSHGLTADDFKDVDPSDLTLDMVKERAKSRVDAAQESKLTLAKESGFDTVEEFDAAVEAAKQAKADKVTGMEDIGGGAASSGGSPSPAGGEDQSNAGQEAFDAAKKKGLSDDRALGEGIGALIDVQVERIQSE